MTESASQPVSTETPVQTVAFVSLGCPKNLVDSEKMLGLLAEDGLIPVSDESDADAIVVNTCGFLEASKDESLGVIQEAAERKKAGELKRLIVAGCLVQRHRAKMLEWCPDIDAMIGVFDRDHIVTAVRGDRPTQNDLGVDLPVYSSIAASAAVKKQREHIEQAGYFESDATRLRLTPRHYAYLRISEGCNQNCAFCTIPSIRGKMRSKPLPALLNEASELLADGAFELNLIGQDTTSYGTDISYTPGLSGMLTELDALSNQHGGAWLRLMYAYPSCFTDEMIDTIAALPNVVKYIDMPLQHINDEVLDRMRRKTSRKLIETLLGKLRDRVPGIAIRTTFISGFPGETDAQHNELVAFLNGFGFDAMGVFPYSPEPGTPAGSLHAKGDALPDDVIADRIDELMLAQQEVVFARNKRWAESNAEFDVLIDDESHTTDGLYEGRTYHQAPDIDAITYVQSNAELAPGEVVGCVMQDWSEYDLVAQPIDEARPSRSLNVIQ
jgi:ribosomal protein S12 methylthiotransferase